MYMGFIILGRRISLVEVGIALVKLKSYKSPGTDQIPAELIKALGETLCSETHRLMLST
jgi:hypothetical protein